MKHVFNTVLWCACTGFDAAVIVGAFVFTTYNLIKSKVTKSC